jgi:hypothetical protein
MHQHPEMAHCDERDTLFHGLWFFGVLASVNSGAAT